MGLIPKDTPFFAMELLDGSRPILPAMASAPRVLKINLLLQLLQALSYLHHRRTLHGDIKPSNVLVVDTPQGAVARLPDFSLSSSEGDLSIERLAGLLAKERFAGAAQRCAALRSSKASLLREAKPPKEAARRITFSAMCCASWPCMSTWMRRKPACLEPSCLTLAS
ncbi:MAG: hypothetical protein JNJ46_09975 [Myxococcales bacterium]|nr:hypothetical protein [Myxococcales bacterium]